jgi:hypothetical protein
MVLNGWTSEPTKRQPHRFDIWCGHDKYVLEYCHKSLSAWSWLCTLLPSHPIIYYHILCNTALLAARCSRDISSLLLWILHQKKAGSVATSAAFPGHRMGRADRQDRASHGVFAKKPRILVESTRSSGLLSGFFTKKTLKLYRNQAAIQAF